MTTETGSVADFACYHCGTTIVRDDTGRWVHITFAYACRDRWGGVAPTYAAPAAEVTVPHHP